jgi:CubicO group peptidase (beta-lactamase class C family)
MRKIWVTTAIGLVFATTAAAQEAPAPSTAEVMRGIVHDVVEKDRVAGHIPGTVVGIVRDGKLLAVEGFGVRDPATGRAVDADTRFRIASMSKAFTAMAILKLRDEGKIDLDAAASRYVPELARWDLPTRDSRPITVMDLLHHTAGLVEDNPWGDRQQVLTEPEFTALIESGMDFATAPGVRMEYSNYGYALLGRIVSNVSGERYQDYIRDRIMRPLGMMSTGYEIADSPKGSRAIGYRWQDDTWVREPDMRDGAFGAMGGVETTANDYAKWMAFLLSAWPPGDAPETGPVRRATVRDMVALVSPRSAMDRAAELGPPCRQSNGYATGLNVIDDCELGRVVSHSGGYPGYGSYMLMLPEAGVGMFQFSNRTYAPASRTVFKGMLALRRAGAIPDRAVPLSAGLTRSYAIARQVWEAGNFTGAPLANNVAMDRDLARRTADVAALKAKVGACDVSAPIAPVSAMEGKFIWTCANGKVAGRVQRAPTQTLALQVIDFAAVAAD